MNIVDSAAASDKAAGHRVRGAVGAGLKPDADPRRGVVLFHVSVDWYFCLHWLPLAQAVQAAGYDVALMTSITDPELIRRIETAGLRLHAIPLSRQGMRPWEEWRSLRAILRVLRTERPMLLHAIAQKPVLYGALATRVGRAPALVATLAGMGYVFTAESPRARLLRSGLVLAYRALLGQPRVRVIVQNPDDRAELRRNARVGATLIRGAGVDLARFRPQPPPAGPLTVVLASRMLWDKGLQEFVDAAAVLRARSVPLRMVLVGKPDPSNPSAVPEAQLRQWHDSGAVEWWGHRADMPAVLAAAHIVCLPSYREGLPTILIEAAAAGLPLVATDVPGCREVVRDGENGLLVPPRDAAALADALARLAGDAALRSDYGRASRRLAEAELGIGRVAEETLAVYRGLLGAVSVG
jgi:glycosyltransferase involved in cell wall biosynthesis